MTMDEAKGFTPSGGETLGNLYVLVQGETKSWLYRLSPGELHS
jgi:hypothetical protein